MAYADPSECIGELVRRERARSVELVAIRAALLEAERSGEVQAFDVTAFKQEMLKKAET